MAWLLQFNVDSARHLPASKGRLFVTAAAILKLANGVTNSAAGLVPASVPRPVAKLGVVGVSSLVALWLFGKASSLCGYWSCVLNAMYVELKDVPHHRGSR